MLGILKVFIYIHSYIFIYYGEGLGTAVNSQAINSAWILWRIYLFEFILIFLLLILLNLKLLIFQLAFS
jgi:hypothetical protein